MKECEGRRWEEEEVGMGHGAEAERIPVMVVDVMVVDAGDAGLDGCLTRIVWWKCRVR